MAKTYGDIKPGDTVKGIKVDKIEEYDGLVTLHGTGEPALTCGWADAEVPQ